jgi:hypothetical protein
MSFGDIVSIILIPVFAAAIVFTQIDDLTAYAVGLFTAVTTLFGVLAYIKSCEKEPSKELRVSPNIQLQLDSSLLVRKLTDSSIQITVVEDSLKKK